MQMQLGKDQAQIDALQKQLAEVSSPLFAFYVEFHTCVCILFCVYVEGYGCGCGCGCGCVCVQIGALEKQLAGFSYPFLSCHLATMTMFYINAYTCMDECM